MILIGLGGNLPSRIGEPAATLRAGLERLRENSVEVAEISPLYRSVAWPDASDPPFINAVAEVRGELPPAALLDLLQAIESEFGRERRTGNAPRTVDLDILDFDGRVQVGPPELPHPRMGARAFVLVPLRDVAPGWRHPVSHKTVDELIAALPPETPMPERL